MRPAAQFDWEEYVTQNCRNHNDVVASGRCRGCAEQFCHNCLVVIRGESYCASCKVMTVVRPPVLAESATVPCKLADDALKYAIIGVFFFGIILEPMALSKAAEARRMIDADPSLSGSSKVTAAQVIAWCALAIFVLGLVSRAIRTGEG